jgi:hypothetical protein
LVWLNKLHKQITKYYVIPKPEVHYCIFVAALFPWICGFFELGYLHDSNFY